MSEKWKQKTLLIFPFAVLAVGMILTAAFFLHTYRQIAFEHTSALCETILENSPEAAISGSERLLFIDRTRTQRQRLSGEIRIPGR